MGKPKLTTDPKDYQNPPPPASDPEQLQDKKPFYKKKRFIIPVALVLLILIFPTPDQDGAADRSDPQESSSSNVSSEAPSISSQPDEDGSKKSGTYTLPCGMKIHFNDSVRNDVTGDWKISSTSDSLVPADYAIEYYEEMFSADDEIHGIWNATLKTTTCIKKFENLLFVDTYEYVDGEEHDANKLFGGALLDSQIVDLETGEAVPALGADVEYEPDEEASSSGNSSEGTVIPFPEDTQAASVASSSDPSSNALLDRTISPSTSGQVGRGGAGNGSNFNTYHNEDQQNTSADYVLNTNTMKFHFPYCSSVEKIAPQNYEEFYGTRDDAISMGYSSCGNCHP